MIDAETFDRLREYLPGAAVFFIVTGLWFLLVLPSRPAAGAANGRSLQALIPAFLVGAFGTMIWAITGQPVFAAVAFGVGFVVSTTWRQGRRARSLDQSATDVQQSIATASRALRAGLPMPAVIELLARESDGVCGRAFEELQRRESLGETSAEAIRVSLIQSGRPDLAAFGTALLVHLEVGGNLADTCDRLGRTLLERSLVRRRAKAIMSYGRVAGGVLAIAPFVVVPVMGLSIDDYWDFLFRRPLGNALIIISTGLLLAGTIVMRRTARIEAPLKEVRG